MAMVAPPSSRWPFMERSAGSRQASPPASRGGSLGGDSLAPGFPMGVLRPRSVSPTPLSPATCLAASQTMRVPSVVSSIEVPVPMAVASVDAKGDGRSFIYVGADRNRDGIPDALQASSLPPLAAAVAAMPPLLASEVTKVTPSAGASSPEAPKDGSLLLQDTQVWFNSNRAPLASLIQDVVTQQFLQIKDSMKQEVDRCTKLVNTQTTKSEDLIRGLEAERAVRHTMLIGMRNDFDRQQAQISDIVSSRFTVSAAQDQSLRERDEEMSVIIQNIRQDIEALRAQSRSTFAGNIAYSEFQQKVERTHADLRRDFENFTRDCEQIQNVQTKVVKGVEDLQQKVERLSARAKKEKDAEREQSGQQIGDLTQQLSKQREHQQQVERVILELRKEMHATLAAVAQQKDQLEEQQKSQKALSASQCASEASIVELRRQLDDPSRNKRLEDCIQHLEQECQVANHHITDVARVVHTESAARVELMQSLDAYRAAYLQTCSEYRAELAVVQDRVAVLETVQLEDKGLRERTMEQMERNLQELQNVIALERKQASKQEEGMAQSLRKEIEAIAENCGTVRSFVDHYMQDLTRMVQEESDARLQFAEVFNEYRGNSESALAEAGQRLERSDEALGEAGQRIERLETAQKETKRAMDCLQDASEAMGARTELKAEVEVAMEKIYRLEHMSEDIDTRHSRSSELLQRSLLELRDLILEGERAARGSEAAVLSEAAALRGSLECVSSGLTTVAGDVEVERVRRTREASALQTEIEAMRSQLQHLEVAAAESESTVTELRRITEPGLQSVSEDLHVVAADIDKQRASAARETSKLHTGMDAMRQKLATLESAANGDRGWRQQAVQDLEVILGDLRHITPTVAPSRSLPTLARALRLSKS